jgi:hypothetical protein
MPLSCFTCQAPETADHPLAVCHHCGRPVCRDHRAWLLDPVFHGLGRDWDRAVHCPACHSARHPQLTPQGEPAAPRTPPPVATPPPLP